MQECGGSNFVTRCVRSRSWPRWCKCSRSPILDECYSVLPRHLGCVSASGRDERNE